MISRDFLPNVGGIAAHVYELSRALVQQGHHVHVVKTGYGKSPTVTVENLDGIQVHRLFSPGRIRRWRFITLLRQVRRYVRDLLGGEQIDILHWHVLISGSYESRFLDAAVPSVFSNHSSVYLEMVEKPWTRLYLRWLLAHADYIIAPSEELAEKTSRIGYPSNRVEYIPNGVDIQKYTPAVDGAKVRADLGLSRDAILVLCPRRLAPKNGVIYLVQAFPAVKRALSIQVKLLIAGGGFPRERKRIQKQIASDGTMNDIALLGNVHNDRMPALYAAADIVVLPSLIEAVSIAGLEAMSTGKPLVGTNVGGIPVIIEEGVTGHLVPPRDPHALAAAVLALSKNPDKRRRMGEAGRQKVEREFRWDIIAQRTVNIYKRVLQGGSSF